MIRTLFRGTERTTYQEKDGRPRMQDKRVRFGQFQRWRENQVGRMDKEDTGRQGKAIVRNVRVTEPGVDQDYIGYALFTCISQILRLTTTLEIRVRY